MVPVITNPTTPPESAAAPETESVLVMPRAAFLVHFGQSFLYRPLPDHPQAALNLVRAVLAPCRAEPRTAALEADPSLKQLIAYTVLRRPGVLGPEFWAYRRPPKDGDARLRGRVSVGVGGHVRLADTHGHGPPFTPDALINAASRELAEEVGPESHRWVLGLMGFVNDEGNDVGRCHLGFVFRAVLPYGGQPENPEGVEPLGWHTAASLQRMAASGTPFESWSGHILGALHTWDVGHRGAALAQPAEVRPVP